MYKFERMKTRKIHHSDEIIAPMKGVNLMKNMKTLPTQIAKPQKVEEISRFDHLKKITEKLMHKEASLATERDIIHQKAEQTAKTISSLEDVNKTLIASNSKYQSLFKTQQRKQSEIVFAIQCTEKLAAEMRNANLKFDKDLKDQEVMSTGISSLLSSLDEKLNVAELKCKELEEATKDSKKVKEFAKKNDDLASDIVALNSKIEGLEEKLKTASRNISMKDHEISEIKAQNESLVSELSERIREKCDSIRGLEDEKTKSSKMIQELTSSEEAARAKISNLELEIIKKQESFQKQSEKLDGKEAQVVDLNEKFNHKDEELKETLSKVRENEKKISELTEMYEKSTKSLAEMENANSVAEADKKAVIANLRKDLKDKVAEVKDLAARRKDSERECLEIKNTMGRCFQESQTEVYRLKEELEKAKQNAKLSEKEGKRNLNREKNHIEDLSAELNRTNGILEDIRSENRSLREQLAAPRKESYNQSVRNSSYREPKSPSHSDQSRLGQKKTPKAGRRTKILVEDEDDDNIEIFSQEREKKKRMRSARHKELPSIEEGHEPPKKKRNFFFVPMPENVTSDSVQIKVERQRRSRRSSRSMSNMGMRNTREKEEDTWLKGDDIFAFDG